jgi:hypothetical protein
VLTDVISAVSDIAGSIGDANDALKDAMRITQDILGAAQRLAKKDYIGAAVAVITSAISTLAGENAEAVARAKKMEGDYWDAVNYKIERQIELMKELHGIRRGSREDHPE